MKNCCFAACCNSSCKPGCRPAGRAALVSGLLFGLCHAFLATTVTQVGAPVLVFTVIEGVVAGLVYCRAGLLGAALAHGLAIFALAAGWV